MTLLGVGGQPHHSPIGIGLAVLSLLVMPALSLAQRRTGREIGSLSAVADSKQTLLCGYLSAVLLAGLVLNSLFGWSWADPVARSRHRRTGRPRRRTAWRGDACCAPTPNPARRRTHAGHSTRPVRRFRRTRIRLAQLASAPPHGFDGIQGCQRPPRISPSGSPASASCLPCSVAVAAPILQWAGMVAPVAALQAGWIQAAGIVLALLGNGGTVYAQIDLGDSWRIGVDPGERTTLVRSGVFGRVRNPIFTAMLTFGAGIALRDAESGGADRLRPAVGHHRDAGSRGRGALLRGAR